MILALSVIGFLVILAVSMIAVLPNPRKIAGSFCPIKASFKVLRVWLCVGLLVFVVFMVGFMAGCTSIVSPLDKYTSGTPITPVEEKAVVIFVPALPTPPVVPAVLPVVVVKATVNPLNAAEDVVVYDNIIVTFSQAMDPKTINPGTFKVKNAYGELIEGTVTSDATYKIWTFTPEGILEYNTVYTVTITRGAKDLSGNALPMVFVWTFTTEMVRHSGGGGSSGGNSGGSVSVSDTTAPIVSSTAPANSATGVDVDTNVTAVFSEEMLSSTISNSTFVLENGATQVEGTVSYSGLTAIFDTTDALTADTNYSATITTGATDPAGNPIAANYTWNFTTALAPVWVEHSANPVFDPVERAYYPSILFNGTAYNMWYGDGVGLRRATSADGINWTAGLPATGLANAHHPVVEYADSKYIIWYWDTSQLYSINAMRSAESDDGINWTLDRAITQVGVSVINSTWPNWNTGSYGPIDVFYNPAGSPTIVSPVDAATVWQNKFVMYYDGTTGAIEDIGLAVSADGKLWQGYNNGASPVLSHGATGAWDDKYATFGTVLKIGSTYHMWYSGGKLASNEGIGYAQSADGISWIKSADNPLFHRSDGVLFRAVRTYTPSVIYDPNGFSGQGESASLKMWYTGVDSGGNYAVGYASLENPPATWN